MIKNKFVLGFKDILTGLQAYRLAALLGWQDVRQRYRRSSLGPFWLTLSMGVMIGSIGLVFGTIFQTPLDQYLPFLCAGMILWGFISSVISEGCMVFITAEGVIKQLPLPLFLHILRMTWRNLIILAHNIIIYPVIMLFMEKPPSIYMLLIIPGLFLVVVNLTWIALVLATLCARYRDLPQIVNSMLQVLFYLTPVMWEPKTLPARASMYLLDVNPAYHLLEIVRAPLQGSMPTLLNWSFCLCLGIFGWLLTLMFYVKYRQRVAYWL